MATKHNSGQQNTYLQAKQTRQVATREVQTKQTSCSSSTITKAKTSLLTISMINISLVRLPQRDEVTEGQGRRDGPVARNGTHQYVKWATCPSRSSDWFKLWRGRGGHLVGTCAWSAANYVLHIRRDAPLLWSAVGQEPVDLIFAPTLSAIRHHSVISTSTRKYQLVLPIRIAKVEPIAWNNPCYRIRAILATFPRLILREVEVSWYFWQGICFLYLESRNLGAKVVS